MEEEMTEMINTYNVPSAGGASPSSDIQSLIQKYNVPSVQQAGQNLTGAPQKSGSDRAAQYLLSIGVDPRKPKKQTGMMGSIGSTLKKFVGLEEEPETQVETGVVEEEAGDGLFDTIKEGAGRLAKGAVGTLAGGPVGFVASQVAPEGFFKESFKGTLKSLGETAAGLSELGQEGMRKVSEFVGIDIPKEATERPEGLKDLLETKNTTQKVFKMGSDVAQFFIPAAATVKAQKAIQAWPTFQKLPKVVQGIVSVAPEAFISGGVAAGQEGEINKNVGLVTGLPFVGKGIASVAGGVKNHLFRNLVKLNKSQQDKLIAKGIDLGPTMQKTGITFTKKGLEKKVQKLIEPLTKTLDKQIDDAARLRPGGVTTMDDISKSVSEYLKKNPNTLKSLRATPIDKGKVYQQIDDVLNGYKQLYGNKPLGIKDVQSLKVAIGRGLSSEFDRAINAVQRVKPFTEKSLRKELKTMLDKLAPDTIQTNKELAPLYETLKILEKKGKYSSYLTDTIIGGAALAGGPSFLEDPLASIGAIVSAIALKHGVVSMGGKSVGGSLLREAEKFLNTPGVMPALKEAIDQGFGQAN